MAQAPSTLSEAPAALDASGSAMPRPAAAAPDDAAADADVAQVAVKADDGAQSASAAESAEGTPAGKSSVAGCTEDWSVVSASEVPGASSARAGVSLASCLYPLHLPVMLGEERSCSTGHG